MGVDSGADSIEANFSCPNVASADGQLYQKPDLADLVAERLRRIVRKKPLLIKIGHITDETLARSLIKALAPHVDALVMVNCISAKVLDQQGQALFQGQSRGIAGASIYNASLLQIQLFNKIVRRNALGLAWWGWRHRKRGAGPGPPSGRESCGPIGHRGDVGCDPWKQVARGTVLDVTARLQK